MEDRRAVGAILLPFLLILSGPGGATAQEAAPGCWVRGDRADLELRASPYDSATVALEGGAVKVCYGRPRKLGRPIMGRLVPYGEPWRLGANEATHVHLPRAATVAGVAVESGWYSLYAVPGEASWRVVVNGDARRWGIPIDDEVRRRDVGSGTVVADQGPGVVELLTLELEPTGPDAADLVVAWDRTRVRIPLVLGTAAPAADSAAVAAVVSAFHDALARGDSARALELLTPEARILEGGGVETAQEYASHHLGADIAFASALERERGPLRVVVRGDVAWTTSTSRVRGTYRDRDIDSRGAELVVLARRDGAWRIEAIHWSSR